MAEYIKFQGEEPPKKNPNPPNDIYKKDGAKGTLSGCLMIMSIGCMLMIGGVFFSKALIGIVISWGLGISMVFYCIKRFYQKSVYRKKIIENGTPYPGVVVRTFENTQRISSGNIHNIELTTNGISVRYADTYTLIKGIDGDPRKYLENPYCTVYVWNGKVIATDFKVRDEYIAKNGKAYLMKPRKVKR